MKPVIRAVASGDRGELKTPLEIDLLLGRESPVQPDLEMLSVGKAFDQGLWCVHGADPAPEQNGHARAQLLGFLDVVRGQKQGLPHPAEFENDVVELMPDLGIQPGRRLIQDDEIGIPHEGQGEGEPLFLPAGEPFVELLALWVQTDQGEEFVDRPRMRIEGGKQMEQLLHPDLVRKRRNLELAADEFADLAGRRLRIDAENADLTPVPVLDTEQDLDERGFAGTVWSQKAENLTRPDSERGFLKGRVVSVGFAHVDDFDGPLGALGGGHRHGSRLRERVHYDSGRPTQRRKPCMEPPMTDADLMEQARRVLVGGVNSPVRAYHAVGGVPVFVARGSGAEIWSVDGTRYLDCVGSWGTALLGHADPDVVAAVVRAARDGLSFGAPTPGETELARRLVERVPGIERVRLVSSGTEATLSAIRLARAVTGRDGLIKFAGGYHGHGDSLLVEAGSGALTGGHPSSPGVPAELARLTRVLPYNDAAALRDLLDREGERIGAVIVEIVAGNMGCVPPHPDFLAALTEATRARGVRLIADEVMTGFRVGPQGALGRYGLSADLVTLGKIIGGGLPLGALAGRASDLDALAPVGPVYQAGTLSGNPLSVASGVATLDKLGDRGVYQLLEERTDRLAIGLEALIRETGIEATVHHVPGMWSVFFCTPPVDNLTDVRRSRVEHFRHFFHHLKTQGILLPPSPYESAFLSLAHEDHHIDRILEAARQALRTLPA